MDCPHCATENLVGSRICAACGQSMISRPPGFGQPTPPPPAGSGTARNAAPATPPGKPPPVARSGTVRSMSQEMTRAPATWGRGGPAAPVPEPEPAEVPQIPCRVCRAHYEAKDASDGGICDSCRSLSAQAERMVPSDVQMVPQSDFEAEADFRNRMGSSNLRPKPIAEKKVGLRTGPVAAIVGLVLGLAGLGVVTVMSREPDRAQELLGTTTPGEAAVTADPGEDFRPRHAATLRMRVLREESRAFGGDPSKRVDFLQTSVLEGEAALVREDDEGDIYDVRCATRLTEQTGSADGEDAREANLHPWLGTRAALRVRAPDSGPLVQLDGASVIQGGDVVPLFHVGSLGAPGRTFRTGDRWKTEITLPALTDRQGRLVAWPLPVDVSYAGLASKLGTKCAAFKVVGTAPKTLPGPLGDVYDHSNGKVAGAVWVELATGIVIAADIESTFRFWKQTGKFEESLSIEGRLSVERK